MKATKKTGFYRTRNDHNCFFALLVPIPDRLDNFASLDWENFISYVEIENLLPDTFLIDNSFASEQHYPGGKYLKIKDSKKSIIWESLFNLPQDNFSDFKPLFRTIIDLFGLKPTTHDIP